MDAGRVGILLGLIAAAGALAWLAVRFVAPPAGQSLFEKLPVLLVLFAIGALPAGRVTRPLVGSSVFAWFGFA